MSVAAETGTAKLKGAIETSRMKLKNETAIAQVDRITHLLRTNAPKARVSAPG